MPLMPVFSTNNTLRNQNFKGVSFFDVFLFFGDRNAVEITMRLGGFSEGGCRGMFQNESGKINFVYFQCPLGDGTIAMVYTNVSREFAGGNFATFRNGNERQ